MVCVSGHSLYMPVAWGVPNSLFDSEAYQKAKLDYEQQEAFPICYRLCQVGFLFYLPLMAF